jgi:DNA ligase-1
MLLGDVAETVRLAAAGRLGEARMRLMHPIGFMLASPAEDAAEAALSFPAAQVEDKYDGIRAQAHVGHDEVKLFSRTLDDVTGAFPELTAPLAALPAGVILDGEIVAWSEQADDGTGRALPFAALQRRLGRKSVSTALLREVPVAYVAFDVLYAGGRLLIDEPLRARAAALHALLAAPARTPSRRAVEPSGQLAFPGLVAPAPRAPGPHGRVIRAAVRRAASAAELEALFEDALGRGNEGLMVKDLDGVYTPGRRGRLWLKLKRELATLDVVVTAVEYGHGKRHEVLSDYTFAVRDGERLVNVGKAYSGLTDAEIAGMTDWFLGHTAADHGFLREVEPRIVLEVAFNAVMRSDRHESGYTLRFPRILRLRPDKLPSEIDGIERVRALFDQQHARRPR